MRACPMEENKGFVEELDKMAKASLHRLLGVALTDDEQLQAELKTSLGGLGMRNRVDHQSAALISCSMLIRSLVAEILGLNPPDVPPPSQQQQRLVCLQT